MNFDWGDTGVNVTDRKASLIPGKVGTAMLPGSKRVWNDQTQQWDTFPEAVRVPFLAFGGWQAAVPANSHHIEAAWHFIAWLSSPEVSGEAVVTPQSGINPYRQSHFHPQLWLKLFTPEEARLYLDTQLNSLNTPERRSGSAYPRPFCLYPGTGGAINPGAEFRNFPPGSAEQRRQSLECAD
jgi:multiple sugar transport system substrate-binding protein